MRKPKTEAQRQVDRTIALTTGVIGIGVADTAALSIPSALPQYIVRKAVIPTAATSMLPMAGEYGTGNRKRRKK